MTNGICDATHTIDGRKIRRLQRRYGVLRCKPRRELVGQYVALNEIGRDCDGYDMDSITFVRPAEVDRVIDRALNWADGPLSFRDLSARELEEWYAYRDTREDSLRTGWDDDRFDATTPEDF